MWTWCCSTHLLHRRRSPPARAPPRRPPRSRRICLASISLLSHLLGSEHGVGWAAWTSSWAERPMAKSYQSALFLDADTRVVELIQDVIDVTAENDTCAEEVRLLLVEERRPGGTPHRVPVERRPQPVDLRRQLRPSRESRDVAVCPAEVEVRVVRVVRRRNRVSVEQVEPVERVRVVLDPVGKTDLRPRLLLADRRPVAAGGDHLLAGAEADPVQDRDEVLRARETGCDVVVPDEDPFPPVAGLPHEPDRLAQVVTVDAVRPERRIGRRQDGLGRG